MDKFVKKKIWLIIEIQSREAKLIDFERMFDHTLFIDFEHISFFFPIDS